MSQETQLPERPPLPDLPANAWALLGLLAFGDALTGYELKQRADLTLRFYWQAPAMSQVYSELRRLTEAGLVAPEGTGRGTKYAITEHGRASLRQWLAHTPAGFPVWKHPVALRLMIGHLTDNETLVGLLERYVADVEAARADLLGVLDFLATESVVGQRYRHPALVAEWGVAHFDAELTHVRDLIRELATTD